MSYILTIWLLVSGELIGADVTLPGDADCARTAALIAADNGATLVNYACVLEMDA